MIEALFVGGPMNGRQESLARPFPTHAFRMYQPKARESWLAGRDGIKPVDTHCLELTYVLDLKNFEPYVYVLKGLRGRELDVAYEEAVRHARGDDRDIFAFQTRSLLYNRPA